MGEEGEISTPVRIWLGIIVLLMLIILTPTFMTLAQANTDPLSAMLVFFLPFILMVIVGVWMVKGKLFKDETRGT